MTIAELHGKLAPKRPGGHFERMEDLLTSDVFGTMKYAGWDCGFLDWIRFAQDPWDPEKKADKYIPSDNDILFIDYLFWPTLKKGREPDLLMVIHNRVGDITLLMIEAKYLSGPSNYEIENEYTIADSTGDQIADQINDFSMPAKNVNEEKIKTRVHIYLTAHYACPTETFFDSRKKITRYDVKYFWLNWQSLFEHIKPEVNVAGSREKLFLEDLLALLKRKDLIPFTGFEYSQFNIGDFINRGFWEDELWKIQIPTISTTKDSFWRE